MNGGENPKPVSPVSVSVSLSPSVSCSLGGLAFFFFFELLQVLLLEYFFFFNKTENLSLLVSCPKWHVLKACDALEDSRGVLLWADEVLGAYGPCHWGWDRLVPASSGTGSPGAVYSWVRM